MGTKQTSLRKFTESDRGVLLAWLTDPEILSGLDMEQMSTDEFDDWINDGKIILILEMNNISVGMINFYNYHTEPPEYEVGYLIDPAYQGHGLGNQIVELGLSFLEQNFPEASMIRDSYVLGWNKASRRILERNGFRLDFYDDSKQRYYYSRQLK